MEEGRFKTVFFIFSIALIASLGSMVCGSWIGWSPATYLMKNNQTDLDMTDYGMMIAMYDLGNIISPIPCGYLLTYYGRKWTIRMVGPMNIVSWVAIILFPSQLGVLYVARLFAELAKRMTFSSIPIHVKHTDDRLNYTQLNMLGLIFSVFGSTLCPYYLMQQNRRNQAEKSLRSIRAKYNVTNELELIDETVTDVTDGHGHKMQSKTTYRELFQNKANRRALIITAAASMFQRLSGISLVSNAV